MPRTNKEERRRQITTGLMTVMAERGYERASTAAIARAAGLTPGLLHYHFENKQEILLAVGESLDAVVQARFDRRGAGSIGRQAVSAFIDAHLELDSVSGIEPDAAPEHVACWVALAAEAAWQPEVGALYRQKLEARHEQLLGLLIETLAMEGRTTSGGGAIATTILATIEGYYQLGTAASPMVPRGSAAGAVRHVADRLLDAETKEER